MTSHFWLKLLSLPPFSLALHSNEMRSRTSERIQLMRLILRSDLWIISLSFYLNSNYLLSISEIILGSKTPKALLSAVVYQPTRSAFVMSPLTWSDWRHCRGRPCTCSSPPPPSPRCCSQSCLPTSTASCFWVTGRGTVTDWAVDGGGGGGGEGGRERRRRRLRRTAQAVTQGSPEGKQPLLPAQTLCCPSSSRGGRLTSLDASFMRCFGFFQTSSKTSRSMFFQNIAETSHC